MKSLDRGLEFLINSVQDSAFYFRELTGRIQLKNVYDQQIIHQILYY